MLNRHKDALLALIAFIVVSGSATGESARSVDVSVEPAGESAFLPSGDGFGFSRDLGLPLEEVPLPVRGAEAAGVVSAATDTDGLSVTMAGVGQILMIEWPESADGRAVSDGQKLYVSPLLEFEQDSDSLVATAEFFYDVEGKQRIPLLPNVPVVAAAAPNVRASSRIDPDDPLVAVAGTFGPPLDTIVGSGLVSASSGDATQDAHDDARGSGYGLTHDSEPTDRRPPSRYLAGEGPPIGPSPHKTRSSSSVQLPDQRGRAFDSVPIEHVVGTAALILLLGPVLLYHRIRTNEALENATRKRIHDMIVENPGVSIQAVSREARVSHSTATYHLDRLVAAGIAIRIRDGNKVRYYRNGGSFTETERKFLPLVKNRGTMRVLSRMIDRPDVYRAKIASDLGLSTATINWHLRRLFECGIVEEMRDGRHRFLRVDGAKVSGTFDGLKTKVGTSREVEDAENVLGLTRKPKDSPAAEGGATE